MWQQKDHAANWILRTGNTGEHCSIDESLLCEEVYTILSNKDGHGRQGNVIAIAKGTRAYVVSQG
jgi:transposase